MPFREELSFTDDYLGIEVVRFGADKLRVVREIEPSTLELPVPSMLLQPLIENSIKHGLEPRIAGGTITLRSRLRDGNLLIEIEDDGVGIAPERALAHRRPHPKRQWHRQCATSASVSTSSTAKAHTSKSPAAPAAAPLVTMRMPTAPVSVIS